jgi:hypothetical protein
MRAPSRPGGKPRRAADRDHGNDRDAAEHSQLDRYFQRPIAKRAVLGELYDAVRSAERITGELPRIRLAILCAIADARGPLL